MKFLVALALISLVGLSLANVVNIPKAKNVNLKSLFRELTPAKKVSNLDTWTLLLQKVETPSGSSIGCGACTFFFDSFTSFLAGDAQVLNNVITAVQKICTQFPAAIEPQCIDFLAQYGSACLYLTIKQLDPKQLCTEMKACSASDAKALAAIPEEKASLAQCQTCATFMDTFQREIASAAGQKQIIATLDNICLTLPSPYSAECTTILNSYQAFLFEALASLTADSICPLIGMCPKQ